MQRLANQIANALIEAGLEATLDRSGLTGPERRLSNDT